MNERTQRRLAAIVVADVVGYSRMMGVDETGTLAAFRSHRRELIDPAIEEHGGRIVKTTGDGLLLEFPSVVDAVRCSIAVQDGLAERNADVPTDNQIILRIGINLGDIIIDGDDILGDGINIAARLEGIAEPGGICISSRVHDDVRDRLDASFVDGGEQELKNIARPVRVWRWPSDTTSANSAVTPSLALPDKPSIAVLPFANMSGDPGQDFFADGMTEDIITELSRFHDLLVIARNSAFTYKGRTEKAQKIGRELNVKYIAEGSVRKSNDRVRISVQLIDCDTGGQLWAERYDRNLVDIFDLQDELTAAIVGLLPGRIRAAEMTKIHRKPPEDMVAFDCLLAGKIHHHRITKTDNAEALRLLNKAIELDPKFGVAYAWKACTLGQAIEYGFDKNIQKLETEAISAVQTALSFDENDVECHRLLCEVSMERKSLDEAMFHNERAISLNPNDPRLIAQRGELLTWLGRPGEGVECIIKALRLDPFDTVSRAHLLGRALYGCQQYRDALAAYKKNTAPRYGHLAELAACYGQLGLPDEAAPVVAKVLQLNPNFGAQNYVAGLSFERNRSGDHLLQGLIFAGLPKGDL